VKVNRVFDVVCLMVVLAGLALAAVMYPRLPDPMPSHWNAAGDINGWMPRFWGVMIFPIVMAAIWLMFLVLPRISPRGFEMDPFVRAWGYLRVAFLAFMLYIEVIVFQAAQNQGKMAQEGLFVAVGVLFVLMGNFLGKVTRNFFVGIRTPWTLANEEVWLRTHRLGGKCFVAAGFAVVAISLLGLGPWAMMAVILAAALVPVVYSYVIYRKLEGPAAAARPAS
jgi:immunity protein, SdpI family